MIGMFVPLLLAAAAAPANELPATRRIEVRLEIAADRADGVAASCEAVTVRSVTEPAFTLWGMLFDGNVARCGSGAPPDIATAAHEAAAAPDAAPAPLLLEEIAATVGWDEGTMDPGPVESFQVFLTLKTRWRAGSSKEGTAEYAPPMTDRRSTRLERGEEFVVPLPFDAKGKDAEVRQVLARVRVEWAGREAAAEYGTLAVTGAVPGSEILVDGGGAGLAGGDGTLLLPEIPTGVHEVRLRGTSGSIARPVLVVKGRTVPVTTDDAGASAALKATGKNAAGFDEYRRERDGATMIAIPEGEFLMGNLATEGKPLPHTVSVSRFLIDKLPLTVARYRKFAAATGRPLPPDPYWGVHDEDPVSFVRWDEAKSYCEWAGARLPTEAEREKAARGTDERLFPWGSEPPSPERAVFRRNWGQQGNDTAGARPSGASPYGLLDAGGNMWEYCEDWYSPDYFASSPKQDPAGPKTGRARIVKGGSWDSRPTVLSASSRNFAYTGYREGDFGFRCAASPPR